MVLPWLVMNRTVARTPSSLLSHQGLSCLSGGQGGVNRDLAPVWKGGCKFTLGLEAPFQEIRINAAQWLLVAAWGSPKGLWCQRPGWLWCECVRSTAQTFIMLTKCVVFSNELQGFSMWGIFAERDPISVTADVLSAALWRKGTGTSRSGLSVASTRQYWEFLKPLEGKQKHFLSRKYVFGR